MQLIDETFYLLEGIMIAVEKTLARRGNRVLVLTSEGGLLMLVFPSPVPHGFDIGDLSNLPASESVWEADYDIPIPVCHAEINPASYHATTLEA